MQRYEFKVVPAPRRAQKAKALKSNEERFAQTLALLMNELGAEGWDYVRADALPCDERSGLTGVKTSYHNVLVFRRPLGAALAAQPVVAAPVVAATSDEPEGQASAEPVKVPAPVREVEEGPTPALGPAK